MKNKYMRYLTGLLILLTSVTLMPLAQAQEYVWAPDLPAGSAIPAIDAPDQNGENRSFANLVGENGVLLMFSRSFDW